MKNWTIAIAVTALVIAFFCVKHYIKGFYPMFDYNRIQALASMLSQVKEADLKKANISFIESKFTISQEEARSLLEVLRARNAVPELPKTYNFSDFNGGIYQISLRRPTPSDTRWISSSGRSGPNDFIAEVYSRAIDQKVAR